MTAGGMMLGAEFDARVRKAQHDARDWHESEVRRMLGEWVSGLDPVLAYDWTGRLVGLSIAGVPEGVRLPMVVRARERACRVCGCVEHRACLTDRGPCAWVGPDLCSGCG